MREEGGVEGAATCDERSESRKRLGCGMGIIAMVTEEERLVRKYMLVRFLPLVNELSADRVVSPSLRSSSNLTFSQSTFQIRGHDMGKATKPNVSLGRRP